MANKDVAFTPGTSTTSPETVSMLREFWSKTMEEIKDLMQNDFKTQELPLARIKKIMKLDEDVKMISAEAPVLFAKAAEIFISELSLRAWIHTEDNKRRTLQRNDIAMAISKFDQFDFLIDIVPREELKPAKRSDECVQRTSMMPDQVQYYFQLAQQAQAGLQQQGPTTTAATATATTVTAAPAPTTTVTVPTTQPAQAQGIQIQAGQVLQQVGQQFQLQIQDQAHGGQHQIIQVQVPQQQAQPAQPQQIQQAAQQTTQVLHQIVTPSGDIQNIPIQLTADQLAAIQLQVQGKQPGQPIIIQTAGSPSEQIQIQQNQQPMFQIQQVGGQQVFIQQAEEATQEAE